MNLLSSQFAVQVGLSVISVIAYFIVIAITGSAVIKYGKKQEFIESRIIYIKKFFRLSTLVFLLISIAIIWGIDFRGILILASSLFAVVGIALFAQWSILSNITSGVILFFAFPYKIGDRIKIVDADNSIEGEISDMTMFSLRIKDDNDNIVSYPNNLAMQKPIISIRNVS